MSADAEPDLQKVEASAEHQQESNSSAYKVVSVRLRIAEFEAFSDQAEALGLTNNMALRIAARRVGGFLEIDHEVRGRLDSILTAIGEVSINVRNLHAEYIASGKIELDDLAAQRDAFGYEFAELDAQLRSILNVSQRRSDGRRMLSEAMV